MTFRAISAFLVLFTPAIGCSPHASDLSHWPDASRYWHVIMNADQNIENYVRIHPEYFVHDKLVTDLGVDDVKIGGEENARQTYKRVRSLLESKGMYVGTYVSGRTVSRQAQTHTRLPPYSACVEEMPPNARYLGSWPSDPDRKIIDVDDADTRHALERGILRLWKAYPAPFHFVDNMTPHPMVQRGNSWKAACQYMAELREMGESLGSRVLFNIPMHVGLLSDQETHQLIRAVGEGGIVLEMPWHSTIRQSKQATDRAAFRYRQLLDSGMAIVMIPVSTPLDQLTSWVQTWRKPTDRLYVAVPFFKPPPAPNN